MNKWQLICPFVAVVVSAVVLGFPTPDRIKRQRQARIVMQVANITQDLAQHTNSSLLVAVSPQLKDALQQVLSAPTDYRNTFRVGDEPAPIGDGTATHRIYIGNLDGDTLALRVRHDPQLNKFHVLSFWHPTSWPGASTYVLPAYPSTNSPVVQ